MNQPELINALVILAILFLLFLIFRELVCWYWKINQSVALLTEIRDSLKQIENSERGTHHPLTPTDTNR